MTEPKKRGRPRKKPTVKVAEATEETVIDPPKENKPFFLEFEGKAALIELLEDNADQVFPLVRKFEGRHHCKLVYIAKFRSFKCMRKNQHVDWVTLNDLMKMFDCRVPPVGMLSKPQRPYTRNRIY